MLLTFRTFLVRTTLVRTTLVVPENVMLVYGVQAPNQPIQPSISSCYLEFHSFSHRNRLELESIGLGLKDC